MPIDLSRRGFLRGLGAGPLVGGMGASGLLGWAPPAWAGQSGRPMKLITILCWGGWDVTLCMDPKPGHAEIEDGTRHEDASNPDDRETLLQFGDLPIMTNAAKRPEVTSFFEDWYDRICVVNGIWTGSLAHEPSRYRMLTGKVAGAAPDVNVIVGATHAQDLPLGSMDLSGRSFSGPLAASTGRIGNNSQILTLLDAQRAYPAPQGADVSFPQFQTSAGQEEALRQHLVARALAEQQRWTDGAKNDLQYQNMVEARERAARIRAESQILVDNLQLGTVNGAGDAMTLAVDLLEAGVCQTAMIDSGRAWDTHRVSTSQYDNYNLTFKRVGDMVQDLADRGMLDDTIVAVVSEMTRTPKYNAVGGKDHWPHTSAILLGGTVAGNRVVGGTDGFLESMPVDLQTGEVTGLGELNRCENFAAGLLELCDVDPGPYFPGITPFRGAHAG